MKTFSLFLSLGLLFTSFHAVQAGIIFESGTLGPTGLSQGSVAATNVHATVYVGVRFQLTQPVLTTEVGGHFVSHSNGTFFGAIVALDDGNDFPDSGDLSTSDVLGHTELTFPVPSDEVFGDLSLSLDSGWYALVFGSGLFGTIGDGAAPRNNTDIDNPSYFVMLPNSPSVGTNVTTFPNMRLVVKGRVIPEPTSIGLVTSSFIFLCLWYSNRNR